jgi:hypothetical protein
MRRGEVEIFRNLVFLSSSMKVCILSSLAQLVERGTVNLEAVSSILTGRVKCDVL